METTSRPPLLYGTIFLSLFASNLPSIPSNRGIEKPQISASSNPVVKPKFSSPTARFVEIVDFPTPPLPLPTAITLVRVLIFVGIALSRAFFLAIVIKEDLSSLLISTTFI